MQNSRSSDDITYADLGPNTAARAAHLQTSTLLHDDRVQYEEIQHEAIAGVPVCGPQTSNQLLGISMHDQNTTYDYMHSIFTILS